MKKLKKLSASKEVIETLDGKVMKNVVGGITGTCSGGCPTRASTITLCSGNPAGCGTCTSGCPCKPNKVLDPGIDPMDPGFGLGS